MRTVSSIILLLLFGILLTACGSPQGEVEPGARGSQGAVAIEITPQEATAEHELRARVRGGGHGGRIFWERNGVPLGVEGEFLPAGSGVRGDLITAVLELEEESVEASVVLSNAPPKVVWAGLQDPHVRRGKDIVIIPETHDADGDNVWLTYRWSVNGIEISEADGPVLQGHLFSKGDQVEVGIIPFDGQEEGPAFPGRPLVIPNAPPRITSSPPADIAEQGYIYQVQAADPDGDVLSYLLEEGPEGMTIDQSTGHLAWRGAAGSLGSHRIRISVNDPEGMSAYQEYTLYIGQ
jgi:hypothetical protein